MARTYCKPECRCCGKTINTEDEEFIKVEDGLIHIDCEEDYAPPTAKLIKTTCFHAIRSRVRTHRGFHCGDCGKRF